MPNLIEINDLKNLIDHHIHRKIDRKHFIARDQQSFTTKFTAYSTSRLFKCYKTCCTIFGKTHSSSRRGCPDINFSKRYCSPIASYANSLESKSGDPCDRCLRHQEKTQFPARWTSRQPKQSKNRHGSLIIWQNTSERWNSSCPPQHPSSVSMQQHPLKQN